MEKVVINQRLSNATYECVICASHFTPKHVKHLTCSESCSREIARNRSALETLAKVDRGSHPHCKDCGKLLTIPVNVKRGFCSYECVVSNRKRPQKTRKMTLTMARTSRSCSYCGGLLRNGIAKPTPQGLVCSEACVTLIAFATDGSERSVHVTRAGCDMRNKVITEQHVELYHDIKARKNKKLRSSIDVFRLPTDSQIRVLCNKLQLEKTPFRTSEMFLNIEVSSLARLANAYAHESGIGVLMLDPLLGWASKQPKMVNRSFIYSHMNYENKDSYAARASNITILRRLPIIGFKGPDYYIYEIASPKNLQAMMELEETDDAMPDMGVRFARELFRTKGISQNTPESAAKALFPQQE